MSNMRMKQQSKVDMLDAISRKEIAIIWIPKGSSVRVQSIANLRPRDPVLIVFAGNEQNGTIVLFLPFRPEEITSAGKHFE